MAKKDLPKDLQSLYFPSAKEPVFVDVPPMQFAMVDGTGDPNSAKGFQEAIGALYGVAYTAKFAAKKEGIRDTLGMPLEGLFWTEASATCVPADKGGWHWPLMLMGPAPVRRNPFDEGVRQLRQRKNPPGLDRVRLERWREGKAAQILHLGPYSAEQPTIDRLAGGADHRCQFALGLSGLDPDARLHRLAVAGRHVQQHPRQPSRHVAKVGVLDDAGGVPQSMAQARQQRHRGSRVAVQERREIVALEPEHASGVLRDGVGRARLAVQQRQLAEDLARPVDGACGLSGGVARLEDGQRF